MMSLYLAPRVKRKKISMTSKQLLEELPDIENLGPYPKALIYSIQTDRNLIISVSIDSADNYMSICDSNNTLQIYCIKNGRKILTLTYENDLIIKS